MKLVLIGRTYKLNKEYLEKVAEAAFSFLPQKDGEIELSFVSESKIQELNKNYRQLNKVTDVLSFEILKNPLLGQVFVCYNKTKEQAETLGHSLEKEAAVLLVHGILHVFGFDHENESDYQQMHRLEEKIITQIRD